MRRLVPALLLATIASHAWAMPPGHPSDVLRLEAQGSQVYRCALDGAAAAWRLVHPDAILRDEQGRVIATHGAGPSWRASDGSLIEGVAIGAVASPLPGAVPWLALRVTRHAGVGLFDGVVLVVRIDTQGGLAPATGCDAVHAGATAAVPYRASYLFVGGNARGPAAVRALTSR